MAAIEQVILAAVTSTPKDPQEPGDEYETRVAEQAKAIALMLGERSPVYQAVEQISGIKPFTAIVLKVVREKSSTRGKVTLKTKPSKWYPDGIETARTERTDNPEGLAMAKRLTELKGHRVRIWKQIQEKDDGSKVGVIQHVKDLGEVSEDELAEAAA